MKKKDIKDILVMSFLGFCFFLCCLSFYTKGWFDGRNAAKKEFLKPSIIDTNSLNQMDDTLRKLEEWEKDRQTRKNQLCI